MNTATNLFTMAESEDQKPEGKKAQHITNTNMLYPVNDRVPVVKDVKTNYGTGHVKIYRSLKEHWLWKASKKKTKLEAWLDLLMLAAFEDTKEPFGYDLIMLKRGQILTSQDKLSKAWLWDRSAVRLFLQQLELDAMIVAKSTSKYTMITICNYASYHERQPSKQQVDNNKTTSKQHIEERKELEEDVLGDKPPKQKTFKQWDKEDFKNEIANVRDQIPGTEEEVKSILNNFYRYWSEKNTKGKMKFQLQATWETNLRLINWAKREFEKK